MPIRQTDLSRPKVLSWYYMKPPILFEIILTIYRDMWQKLVVRVKRDT